jgi:hypothetical protein
MCRADRTTQQSTNADSGGGRRRESGTIGWDMTTERSRWNLLSGDHLISTQSIPHQYSDDPRRKKASKHDPHGSWEHGCTIAAVVAMIHVDDSDGSVDQSIHDGGSAHVTCTLFFIVIP